MSRRAFFFGLAVIAVLIFSLYRAKYGARETLAEIKQVEQQIALEEQRLRSLRAEFSLKSDHVWIEEYARTQLGMAPARAEQFVRLAELDSRLGPPISNTADSFSNAEGAPE